MLVYRRLIICHVIIGFLETDVVFQNVNHVAYVSDHVADVSVTASDVLDHVATNVVSRKL